MSWNSLRVYSVHALLNMNELLEGIMTLSFALKGSKLFFLSASVGEYFTAWSLEASLGSRCFADHVCSWTVRQPFLRTARFRGVVFSKHLSSRRQLWNCCWSYLFTGLDYVCFQLIESDSRNLALFIAVSVWIYSLQNNKLLHSSWDFFMAETPEFSGPAHSYFQTRSWLSPLSVQLMYQEPAWIPIIPVNVSKRNVSSQETDGWFAYVLGRASQTSMMALLLFSGALFSCALWRLKWPC